MSMVNKKFEFKGNYWQFQLIGWTIYLINEILGAWNSIDFNAIFLIRFFTTFAILFGLLELSRLFYKKIYKKIENAALYLGISSIISFVCSFFWREIRLLLDAMIFYPESSWLNKSRDFEYLSGLIYGAWVPFVWSILYFGIKYWQEMNTERERARNAIVMAQNAQLQMLRYQLNPHFLFNSLNSIQGLIHENPDLADDLLLELSEFLRLTLRYNNITNITIAEEVEIISKYLKIEKIRYEERLCYSVNVDDKAMKMKIPCFITQPLVENSIKHGFNTNPNGITLKFNVLANNEGLLIVISNTGKLLDGWEMGVGFRNVQERLQNSYPGKFIFNIKDENNEVITKILIIKHDEKIHITNN